MTSRPFLPDVKVLTTEMHTGGEPVRIIESGFPEPKGADLLEKRAWLRTYADQYRKLVIFEPRGHSDMYGALLVNPDLPEADVGVIFMHNEGYSTMCGHAVIALARYVADRGLVPITSPETRVVIQCPCGPVTAYVQYQNGTTGGRVRFESVPSYVVATDVQVKVKDFGSVAVDVCYGGAFYAIVPAERLGLNLQTSSVSQLADIAQCVTEALKDDVPLHHAENEDLAFFYGTILTDGGDHDVDSIDRPTSNICVFADKQVDRSPTGSGVSARVALQYHRGLLSLGQYRQFLSGVTGSQFSGRPVREVDIPGAGIDGGSAKGVIVEVSGQSFYSGKSTFIVEEDDPLAGGFLLPR